MDLKAQLKAKDRVRPKSGFNVVGVDTYDSNPETAMTVIANYPTRKQAEAEAQKYAKANPGNEGLVFGSEDW